MPHPQGLRIAEVARRTGLPTTTLRYYEEIGLIPPPTRSDAGYRTYDERAVERLVFIARAKSLGCSLEEVGQLTEAWDADAPGPAAERLLQAVDRKVAKLEAKITEMSGFLEELQRARRILTDERDG